MLSVYFCCAVISQKKTSNGSSTTTSSISLRAMDNILQQLKQMQHRDSMCSNYYGIWKNFNKFILRLDIKPTNWEDQLVMYVAYLIHMKRCSTTIKSYISAIKVLLFNGGIAINKDTALLATLTQACRLHSDRVNTKLMISKDLIRLLLVNLQ